MAVPLTSYKTPGVYVQEIRKLPPSIAQVETAIPVFIGYTQKADSEAAKDLQMVPTRIRSLSEYERLFGTTNPEPLQLGINTTSANGRRTVSVTLENPVKYMMHYALQMFYANGGGECFIISVGDLTDEVKDQPLADGMKLLKEQLDPTLILFPDAVSGLNNDKYKVLMEAGIQFCANPKFTNFFLIMDVKHQKDILNIDASVQNSDKDAEEFRKIAGAIDELKYGAAYYPHIVSSIPLERDAKSITITTNTIDRESLSDRKSRLEGYRDSLPNGAEKNAVIKVISETENLIQLESDNKAENNKVEAEEAKLVPLLLKDETQKDVMRAMDTALAEGKNKDELKTAAIEAAEPEPTIKSAIENTDITNADIDTSQKAKGLITTKLLDVLKDGNGNDLPTQISETRVAIRVTKVAALTKFQEAADKGVYTHATLDIIAQVDNGLYNEIITALDSIKGSVVMPPSSAMAGTYARVDNLRGVHKSPANIGLGSVIKPYVKMSDEKQDGFNVDTKAGKSINVIRNFIGRGTLVWGARTLAGNDREWKYVSVRRFFNMVEESVKRALLGFVFEPNNPNTWVSVQASIESFLETQWRAGALLGQTPEDAFQVKVGMPETFSEAEMLDGYMVVEIGMAVVRPAEFIVLKFSHKFDLGQN